MGVEGVIIDEIAAAVIEVGGVVATDALLELREFEWNFAVDKNETLLGGGGIVIGFKTNVQCLLVPVGCMGVVTPLKLSELFKLLVDVDASDKPVSDVGDIVVVVAAVDKSEAADVTGGVTVTIALVVFGITLVAAV